MLGGGQIVRDDGSVVRNDILIEGNGRIAAIGPDLPLPPDANRWDMAGTLISAGFVDMHQHLDKTGVLRFTPNPSGTLQGAREAFAKYARTAGPEDITRRATRTMGRCLSRGTTAIRSHVNVDKDARFNGIEALARLRDEWADRLTLQLVAFMTPHPGQDFDCLTENIDAALAIGDVVGGTPAVSEDPARYIDILFAAAARADKPVDLHLDEHLDPARVHFDAALDCVERYGMQGRTVFSHISVLSAMPRADARRIMDRMIELDVGAVTLPAANLYLQARDHETLPPRGLTRVAELMREGVAVATASDNIQDPFVPTGSGDMLEIARWTLLAGHLMADELADAYRMITSVPARLMGLGGDHGIKVGAWADLVLTDCIDTETLVAGGADRMRVLSRGRLVSETSARLADPEPARVACAP
ncbi:amidohydrolase family protein [Paracoccus sp. WLY502]|uniref:amidohydrolase family protein n=1 Tax=Paracoccus yibinensis TaxID=3068891 RepID=UPI002796C685|nr:amidohydrolase family protein [Paracoccus sp. WLY502]MDQ1901050.1 amidohydrolase family protein [Paracoccus sp. WLY502]